VEYSNYRNYVNESAITHGTLCSMENVHAYTLDMIVCMFILITVIQSGAIGFDGTIDVNEGIPRVLATS
jgi:hypothetical protein